MSDIFGTMPIPYSIRPINKKIQVSTLNTSNLNQPIDKTTHDYINFSNNEKNTENSFVSCIKKSTRDSVIAASLVYTAGSVFNHFRCNTAETANETVWKIPSKTLAIGTGILSAAASLWTLYTAKKMSDNEINK